MKPGDRWALRGYQIRSDSGKGQHVATYMTDEADGRVLASAPRLLEALEDLLLEHDGPLAPVGTLYYAVMEARAAVAEARTSTKLETPVAR